MDGLMAGDADHEGFPVHPGHELRPSGLRPSCPGEVGELADLVDSKTHRDLRVPDRLAFRVLADCFSSRRAKWSDEFATRAHDLPLAG